MLLLKMRLMPAITLKKEIIYLQRSRWILKLTKH